MGLPPPPSGSRSRPGGSGSDSGSGDPASLSRPLLLDACLLPQSPTSFPSGPFLLQAASVGSCAVSSELKQTQLCSHAGEPQPAAHKPLPVRAFHGASSKPELSSMRPVHAVTQEALTASRLLLPDTVPQPSHHATVALRTQMGNHISFIISTEPPKHG